MEQQSRKGVDTELVPDSEAKCAVLLHFGLKVSNKRSRYCVMTVTGNLHVV